jgi:hypothetical protein
MRAAGYVPDGGRIIALADSERVLVRDMSQAQGINVRWFGAKGDGVTDDYNAIVAAINAAQATATATTGSQSTVYFPAGVYRKSKTVYVQKPIRLKGDGSFINEASNVVTDNGQDGFVFTYPLAADTHGNPALGNAQGFMVEGLASTQATTSGTKTIGHGFWAKVRGTFRDCYAYSWGGDGFHIDANATAATAFYKVILADVAQPGLYSDSTAPAVTFVSTNGGSGAVAHAVLGGKVTGLTLTDSGYHYVAKPIVRIETTKALDRNTMHTDGWGASGNATLKIDTVIITNGGTGYTHATVQFTGAAITTATGAIVDSTQVLGDTTLGADTIPAAGNVSINIVNGQVTGVVLVNRGEYNILPRIVITGDGTGATATCYASIKTIYLNDIYGGSWYEAKDTPVVTFIGGHPGDDPLARDAVAKVSALGKFQLKRIEIDNGGDNYYTEPLITLSGGNPITPATARAEIGRDRQGNANQFMIDKSRSVANSNGLVVRGGDVNAGNVHGSDFSGNKQMGIWEASFLGNNYEAGHSTANGVSPIYCISATGFNTFTNYYTEGNQPPILAIRPTIFIGGDAGARILQKAGSPAVRRDINTLSSGVTVQTEGSNYTQYVGLANNTAAGNVLSWGGSPLSNQYNLAQILSGVNTGDSYLRYGSDTYNKGVFQITGANTTNLFGRDTAVSNVFAVHRLALGNTGSLLSSYRIVTMSPAFPPALPPGMKQWAIGDFVINSAPNATTGILGWQRLTKGTGNVMNVDWFQQGGSIQNQNANVQPFNFYIGSNNASYFTNHANVAITPISSISNSGVHFANRFADGYWTMFHLYTSGNTSGLSAASPFSNSSMLMTGGWYSRRTSINGYYKPLETSMTSLLGYQGEFYFMNIKNATVGIDTNLNTIGRLNETGLSLDGTAALTTNLKLKPSTTTVSSMRVPVSGAVLPAAPTNGDFASDGTDVYVRANSAWNKIYGASGGGATSAGHLIAKVAANVTNSTVTMADITGLSASVTANTTYYFTADLQATTTGTGGIALGLNAPRAPATR